MKNEKIKILLVDDEPDILEIIRFNLDKEGYQISLASNGLEAIKIAEKILPQLIILDIMMPHLDGIETCERLRKDERFHDTIVMFLTARAEEYSHVAAFDVGADDYVTKPVKPKILLSKVKGLLRRFKKKDAVRDKLEFKNLIIDREAHSVIFNGKELSVPKKEFELLYILASNPEKIFKREKIMDKVWGSDVLVGDRTIDVHIRKLREKIGNNLFKTVKGVGYKFVQPEK